MSDLRTMEATTTHTGPQCFKPATPLAVAGWQQALAAHPDKALGSLHPVRYASRLPYRSRSGMPIPPARLREFPVGASAPRSSRCPEIEKGRLMGPIPEHLIPLCHCSPIGLIHKPHQPGRWRLIVDLPSPKGHSVNDAISPKRGSSIL